MGAAPNDMKAKVFVSLKPGVLDPQGKAVSHGLNKMGLSQIENVRIGKHITLEIDAASHDVAKQKVEEACKKLLSNPIMENFHFQLQEL